MTLKISHIRLRNTKRYLEISKDYPANLQVQKERQQPWNIKLELFFSDQTLIGEKNAKSRFNSKSTVP